MRLNRDEEPQQNKKTNDRGFPPGPVAETALPVQGPRLFEV